MINTTTASIAQINTIPKPANLPGWAGSYEEFCLAFVYLTMVTISTAAQVAAPIGGFLVVGIRVGRALFPDSFAKTQLDEVLEKAAIELKSKHPEINKATIKKAIKNPEKLAKLIDAEPGDVVDIIRNFI